MIAAELVGRDQLADRPPRRDRRARAVSSMRVPVGARRCSRNWPLSTAGKKSWPSHGTSRTSDATQNASEAAARRAARAATHRCRAAAVARRAARSKPRSKPRWRRASGLRAATAGVPGASRSCAAQQVLRQRRHQRARQEVRREHREHDRLGQRHEQVPGDAGEEEHRHEHDADRERRDERRHRDLLRAVEDRLLERLALLEVAVDVLDRDGGVVDQDADRERQPAERHDVDRLAERAEHDDRGEDRQRDRDRDDQRAAPAAEEQQDHQRGQAGGDERLADARRRSAARTNSDWSASGLIFSSGGSAGRDARQQRP